MNSRARHGLGKSDPLDAAAIASTVLALPIDQLRTPRQDEGIRAATQILLTARDELASKRTRAMNALTALLRITDLGIDARRPLSATKIAEAEHWRTREEPLAAATARAEAIRLAKRIVQLDAELISNMARVRELVEASPAAEFLERRHRTRDRGHRSRRLVFPWLRPYDHGDKSSCPHEHFGPVPCRRSKGSLSHICKAR